MGPTLALIFLFLMPIGCSSQACVVRDKAPEIEENSPVGTLVTEIALGAGYTVEAEPTDTFVMNGQRLQMNRIVDFEVEQVIRATLTCRLNGNFAGREVLIVQIININDNEPKFKQNNYNFNISEALQVGSQIGSAIEAEDADQDTLYYTLSVNPYFRLSSETNPVILVNKRLDFDDAPKVNLNLTVRDTLNPTQIPSHTATASIMIDIYDADDKPPFFLPCTEISTKICLNYGYTGSVTRSEQATGPLTLLPGPLYAVDGDWGIRASIKYSILNGNNENVFNIHETSGNITMNKAANTLGSFTLQVMAYQTDDQTKYSITSVVIEVKEKNNFPPTFEKAIYYGMIPSDSAIRTFVLDLNDPTRPLVVFAADGDFADKLNPSVAYTIDNSTAFRILQEGYIMTNAVITTPGTIVLQVSATDSSTNEKATTLVSVEVIAATTTIPTTTTTTRSSTATNIGTTITTKPGTGTTTTTTRGTGTTTTSTPGTGTRTTTTKGTGTTTTSTPGTGTTTTTTKGTGTSTTSTPGTGTTTTTTKGTGTTTTSTPGTGTTTTTTRATGTTTTSTPGTGTTTTTKGTGTTTTLTPGTGTTTTTTKGTGPTTTSTPRTGTTTTTTKGTGTTTTSTPVTGTTTTTTKGTGTTTTSTPGTGTTTTTTKGTGTSTTLTPGTGTTTTTTKGTGPTTTSTPRTGTTTTTTKGTGTTTTSTPGTGTTTTTIKGTTTTTTATPGTGTATTTKDTGTAITRTPATGTSTTSSGAGTTQSITTRTDITDITDFVKASLYTATDMAALGASLGAILALSLVGLGYLIHKQYGNSIKRKFGKGSGDNSGDSKNSAEQLINDDDDPTNDLSEYGGFATTEPASTSVIIATDAAVGSAPSQSDPADNQPSETAEADDSDDKKVKSILTKELKEDAGYKAVWFREDASPEVVVIEGVEDGEADDYDNEDNFNNQQGYDDDDEDDDVENLDPTFNAAANQSQNSIL